MIPDITKAPPEHIPLTSDDRLLTITVGARIDKREELISDPDPSQQ